MSKWVRVQNSRAEEIITYNPVGVINEAFAPLFMGPFADDLDVAIGDIFDGKTLTFSEPPPAPEPTPTPTPEPTPEPIYVSVGEFRGQLTLSEKLTWDNPDTATTAQKKAITTVSQDFPHRADGNEFLEELNLLESTEVIGPGRAAVIRAHFAGD